MIGRGYNPGPDEVMDEFGKRAINHSKNDGHFAIAYALLRISDSLNFMTWRLGTGNAATDMGAIESIGAVMEKASECLATDIADFATSLENGLESIAEAIEKNSKK
mgnify:CR=1 FL=1